MDNVVRLRAAQAEVDQPVRHIRRRQLIILVAIACQLLVAGAGVAFLAVTVRDSIPRPALVQHPRRRSPSPRVEPRQAPARPVATAPPYQQPEPSPAPPPAVRPSPSQDPSPQGQQDSGSPTCVLILCL